MWKQMPYARYGGHSGERTLLSPGMSGIFTEEATFDGGDRERLSVEGSAREGH